MNLTNRLGSTTFVGRGFGALPRPAPELERLLTRVFLVVSVFVLAGIVGLGLYASAYSGRIYQGVRVAGVDLGGLSPTDARASLERTFTTYAGTPLTLSAGNQTFQITPSQAGAELNSEATVAAAMAWGREGSIWDESRAWARALLQGVVIAPVITVNPTAAHDSLAAIAPDIVKPAVDATLTFDQSGNPAVVPDITGVQLDYAATTSLMTERIANFAGGPVSLVTHDDLPRVTATSLQSNLPQALAAVDAPLVVTAGESVWHVPAAALQPLLSVDSATSALQVDRRPLTAMVEGLAQQVDHPAVDAALTVDDNGHLAVVPAVSAAKVEVEASVNAIANGLLKGEHDVALVVTETPPQILDAAAAAAVDRGEAMINQKIELSWQGGQGTLDRTDLLRALTIQTHPGAQEPFVFGLDPDLVRESLDAYAADFDIPVQDARWRLVNGNIKLVVPESKGRELDLDSGVASVMAAFLDGKTEVGLSVRTIQPQWKETDGKNIELGTNILAEAGIWYGDSSEARRTNVELAASYLNGWLIPPDEVFSFADTVGQITEDRGYLTGLGIVDDGHGGFTTAPVVGGGICQVSTTLFQAVFWSGLPIEERHQHPYYLRTYGEAVSGLPGLDAMVNIEPDWQLDMKFKNTTGKWLAVVMIPDGATLWARIMGTNPGWTVEVPDPVIDNKVEPDDKMYYEDSPELPAGEERIVESAAEGFDVSINRSVYDHGTLILEDSFYSSFAPQRNTTLRGTGTG
jgi:vancomycin resistance protein YoaR